MREPGPEDDRRHVPGPRTAPEDQDATARHRAAGSAPEPGGPARPEPRTLLVTGAGGAGRTTVAAASAVAEARAGRRTLLLSGETSATLQAVLGVTDGPAGSVSTGGAAVPGADGLLHVARTESAERFRTVAVALQERGRKALDLLGSDPLDEDEVTELPGADAFALLSALRTAHGAETWDTIVVDLPHTQDALRVLALPAQLRRWLRRLLPAERQAARALRPALAQLLGVPMPTEAVYEAAARWDGELAAVQHLLESPGTAACLVAEPGPLAGGTLRLGRAGLGLYGLPLRSVVANRLVPTGSSDPWAASLAGQQQTVLGAWREEYGRQGVPVRELPHLGREPRGADDLLHLVAKNSPADEPTWGSGGSGAAGPAADSPGADGTVEDLLARDGLLVWRLALPSVRKEELELVRRGDELILGVGPYRRAFPLPSALRRCRVVGASLDGGELRVRCAPDPALWPEGTVR